MTSAADIAEGLERAKRSGDGWIARCPAHEDRDPSLSITDASDGKVLVHCHAGCDQTVIISKLRSHGLWDNTLAGRWPPTSRQIMKSYNASPVPDNCERTATALRLWFSAVPAPGTLPQIYLRSRGIDLAVPASVRFHPRLKHPDGGTWPGMVALVTRGTDGKPLAIHRTFLSRDGSGKAPLFPQRMMLGPCRGGAVRLATATGTLMVGEGIETCLAAMQATGIPTWAALSTSGLRTLKLPAEIRYVIVLADGDDPGEVAAFEAAKRWKRDGRDVRIARPPPGLDFNDVLLGRLTVEKGDAA